MRSWLLDRLEGIEALRLDESPMPKPAPGEVVLRIDYAALNPADAYLAQGLYPAKPMLPHILGRDGVGTVVEIGADVHGIEPDDTFVILRGETGVMRPGTFAEYVAVDAASLVPVPEGWTLPQAAGASLALLTAMQALTQWGEMPPSVVLVTGASGGVGIASLQLGAAMEHTMVALSRDAAKADALRAAGAHLVLDPAAKSWTKELLTQLDGRRVDLAIDNIGGNLLPQVIGVLGQHGRVSLVGRLAGPVPEFNTATLFFRRIRLGGVSAGDYTRTGARAAWERAVELLDATGRRPLVDSIFPFTELPAAFAHLSHGALGKVLLQVAGQQ